MKSIKIKVEHTQVVEYYAQVDDSVNLDELHDDLLNQGINWERMDKYGGADHTVDITNNIDPSIVPDVLKSPSWMFGGD